MEKHSWMSFVISGGMVSTAAVGASSFQFSGFPQIHSDKVKDEHGYPHNPFKYTDTDIFIFRSMQIKAKGEERCRQQKLKVAEKTTFASRAKFQACSNRKSVLEDDLMKEDQKKKAETLLRCDPSWALCNVPRRPADKESLKDYISKKREMFLAQYSVAVKQESIRSMEEILMKEETKIMNSENKLEEDTIAFEEFLKENDKNSADALKMAELETKNKLEKNLDIRKANGVMMAIKSDISKKEEILKGFLMYEEFLKQISPIEWQEQQNKKKGLSPKVKKIEKIKKYREGRMSSLPPLTQKTESKLIKTASKTDSSKELGLQNRHKSPFNDSRRSSSRSPSIISIDESETTKDTPTDDSDVEEDPEIYFKDPQQLLQVFVDLEEQNLTMIQNCQETDETLEEIRETGYILQEKMNHKTNSLKEHLEMLSASCIREEEKAAELELRAKMFSFGEFKSDQDIMLAMLNKKVSEVYQISIGEIQATVSTLQMLASIENRLEQLHEALESVPRDKVEAAEKAKQKERRLRIREEKLKQQLIHQEERLRRALERATADPKKMMGRKLMFRSKPPATKPKKNEKEMASILQEDQQYFFT